MLNHPPIAQMISEKDRPILGYLANIELDLHEGEKGEGYDLIFTFLPNNYFTQTVIKKELFMKDKNILDKTTSTKIDWKDGCNPCIKKAKKKKGSKNYPFKLFSKCRRQCHPMLEHRLTVEELFHLWQLTT